MYPNCLTCYSSKCKASMAWLYTVLNPTKAAGGVWWIWYSSKCKASMAWLYTVLNPTKAAGGVWWIWYSSKCKASMAWLFHTQSWIQQKQPVEFDGFGTVANAKHPWLGYFIHSPESNKSSRWSLMDLVQLANAKHPWLGYTQSWIQQKQPVEFDGFGTVANAKHPWLGYFIHSPESNKSSRWSLMDLVHMATRSIRWAILWSTESIKIMQNQEKDFGGFGVSWENLSV